MNYSNYRITLDVQSMVSQVSLPVRQGDTGRKIYINLTDGGQPYFIEDGCLATFFGKKADGNPIGKSCAIERNTTIVYELSEQTTTASGMVECEIRLYDMEGKLITSPRFILVVNNRVVTDEDFPLSEEDRSFLDEMMVAETKRVAAEKERADKIDDLTARADEVLSEAEEAIVEMESIVPIANATVEGKILQVVGGKLVYVDMPTLEAPDYEIPTFNFVEKGCPAVSIDGGITQFAMDTTEIMSALDKGAIKAIINFLLGSNTLSAAVVLNNISVSGAGSYICSCAFDLDGAPLIFNLNVTQGAVIAYFTHLSGGDYEIPTFDLKAMGLPSISTGGSEVQLNTDTTEIMAALDNGSIKVIVDFVIGGAAEIELNSVKLSEFGMYVGSAPLNFMGEMVFSLVVQEGVITASVATLSSEAYEIPTFDLRTRGFPTVLADGTKVTHGGDTSDIMTALGKGAVKLIFTVNVGKGDFVVETVLTNTYLQGDNAYLCGSVVDIEGTLAYFSLAVASGAMIAYFSILPTTAIVQALVENYVETYINEALGGDY